MFLPRMTSSYAKSHEIRGLPTISTNLDWTWEKIYTHLDTKEIEDPKLTSQKTKFTCLASRASSSNFMQCTWHIRFIIWCKKWKNFLHVHILTTAVRIFRHQRASTLQQTVSDLISHSMITREKLTVFITLGRGKMKAYPLSVIFFHLKKFEEKSKPT